MKKLVTAVTFAVLMAAPAYAHSRAPEFGSGNIPSYSYGSMSQWGYDRSDWDAYARVTPRTQVRMHRHWDGMY